MSLRWIVAVFAVIFSLSPFCVDGQPAGVFFTLSQLERAKLRGADTTEPLRSLYTNTIGRANTAMTFTPDPFVMADITRPIAEGGIVMGWSGGIPMSLDTAVSKLTVAGTHLTALALAYAFTGDVTYADRVVEYMTEFQDVHTEVNMYDFNINYQTGSFDGMTAGDFQNGRPWNFALDCMWQTYGLVGISDSYFILKKNNYAMSPADDLVFRSFIQRITSAVNSGFHAWTKWADFHTNSGSFTRYRSDNHLSWCLAGLMAAGVALEDTALQNYVINGGEWIDQEAGAYTNPSHIRDVINRAIEADGRVYEELIDRTPPVGYSFFHLWPMMLVARAVEVNTADDVWGFTGANGGSLYTSLDRYAQYILGNAQSPRPEVEPNLGNSYGWLYEFAFSRWRTQTFKDTLETAGRGNYIVQTIGPVGLLVGEQPLIAVETTTDSEESPATLHIFSATLALSSCFAVFCM